MPPSRRIESTHEEDEKLSEVEQNPHLRNKVRLRAQVLRLSGRGSNMPQIASYTSIWRYVDVGPELNLA
jgi:hypothetical protein